MNHFATPSFWTGYDKLPQAMKRLADKKYQLLKVNPKHPSLHFKKMGAKYWSVRIGLHYRALAVHTGGDIVWFWVGSHAEYDQLLCS